jgi:methyl-accepting chemotaxis protein
VKKTGARLLPLLLALAVAMAVAFFLFYGFLFSSDAVSAAIATVLCLPPLSAALVIPAIARRGELAAVRRDLERMQENGRFDVSRGLAPVSDPRIEELRIELDRLTAGLNGIFIDISRSTRKFNLFSSDIFFSARELSDQSKRQSSSMNGILQRVGDFRRALDSLGAKIRSVADDVENNAETFRILGERTRESGERLAQLERLTGEVSEQTSGSRASIEESSRSVDLLIESFRSMDGAMKALGERTASTGKVLSNLQDIAERTHVLATNASIEAARAGNLGAGFSVIAGEIRKLAGNSRDAISEVEVMLRETAGSVIENSERWTGEMARVARLQEFSSRTFEALARVQAGLEEIRGSTGEFSREFGRQSESIRSSLDLTRGVRDGILSFAGVLEEQGAGYGEIASQIESSAANATGASKAAAVLAQLATYLRFGGQELKQVAAKFVISEQRLLEGITRREARRVLLYNLELYEEGQLIGHLGDLSASGLLLYAEQELPLGQARRGRIRLPLEFPGEEYLDIEYVPRRSSRNLELVHIGCSMELSDGSRRDEFVTILDKLTISDSLSPPGPIPTGDRPPPASKTRPIAPSPDGSADAADVEDLEELPD